MTAWTIPQEQAVQNRRCPYCPLRLRIPELSHVVVVDMTGHGMQVRTVSLLTTRTHLLVSSSLLPRAVSSINRLRSRRCEYGSGLPAAFVTCPQQSHSALCALCNDTYSYVPSLDHCGVACLSSPNSTDLLGRSPSYARPHGVFLTFPSGRHYSVDADNTDIRDSVRPSERVGDINRGNM